MEGKAIAWFQWEDGRRPIRQWEELKGMLLERFQPSQEGMMYNALLALWQVEIIRDYRQQFETMAAPLTKVSKQVLESSFINGLRPEIQVELHMLKPTGLGRLIALAQRVEERNMKLKHAKYAPRSGQL